MKTVAKYFVLIGGAAIFLGPVGFSSARSPTTVPYPQGYRRWVHVRSGIIGPDSPAFARFGGLHHIYANGRALEGLKTGNYSDGSVFVFDLLEMRTSQGAAAEGPRRFINVMYKDGKRFAETGGWGFEEFPGDGRTEGTLNAPAKAACFACHAGQKERNFVFSSFRH